MGIYVDEPKWLFRGQLYCHMIADTDDELEAMARRLGLRHDWRQEPKRGQAMAHYDLAPSKRALAVQCGAQEVTGRQLARMMFPHVAFATPDARAEGGDDE